MNTRYGELPNELVGNYFQLLINNVYKILCLREDDCPTLCQYLENLLRELIGSQELITELQYNGLFLSLLATLESLVTEIDYDNFKSDIFKCINIINKLQRLSEEGFI